jgi:hypothetical protein
MGMPGAAQPLAPRAGHRQGFASEPYLNSTSQGVKPEQARKDAHIRGCSRPFTKYPGWDKSQYQVGQRVDLPVSLGSVRLILRLPHSALRLDIDERGVVLSNTVMTAGMKFAVITNMN